MQVNADITFLAAAASRTCFTTRAVRSVQRPENYVRCPTSSLNAQSLATDRVAIGVNDRGRVIVTGASAGIGEATALHLRELGFSVLAGIRNAEDAERLRGQGLTPIRLDVTAGEQLLLARITLGDQPLVGLVNNAGIMCCGPLEFVSIDDVRRQMEVNVIGQLAITQAFMDALRAGRGRIVNVGSLSGILATPITGPYVVSKFALEGFADVLRRELLTQGIDVVMVEPGAVKTPLLKRTRRSIEKSCATGHPS